MKPHSWLIIVLIFLFSLLIWYYIGTAYQKGYEMPLERNLDDFTLYIIQGNSISGLYGPAQIQPMTYGTLIECLELKESSGNENAVGLAGECGCLQFMPSTWELYCVKRYGFLDNIWNCHLQKLCADKMIADGLLKHWTTYWQCIN